MAFRQFIRYYSSSSKNASLNLPSFIPSSYAASPLRSLPPFTPASSASSSSSFCPHSFSSSSSSFSSLSSSQCPSPSSCSSSVPLTPHSLYCPFSVWLSQPKTVAILGAPIHDGQTLSGVEKGPDYIRNGGLKERLEADEWRVIDEGNLDFDHVSKKFAHIPYDKNPRAKRSQLVGAMTRMIYEKSSCHAEKGNLVLTLGGDHSIGIGTIAGAIKARPDSAIIWVDAHGDINTPSTTLSGNIHGMVLSFMMNLENVRNSVEGFEWLNEVPLLNPQRLVYIGLRDLDVGEKKIIKSLGIKAFTMHEIDKYGIAKVMEMVLDYTQGRVQRPIHLSVDIDSVDPAYAPSTGTRVAGGLLYREAYYLCESVAATGMLTSMDLAEVNPALAKTDDDAKATVSLAVGLIASGLGNTIL